MGMNVKASSGSGDEGEMGPVAEINVTPLVDVMLVLLIIFMVTAPVMMSKLEIAMPKPNPNPTEHHDPIIISIDLQESYSIDQGGGNVQQVASTDLPAKLAELAVKEKDNVVFVKAERANNYGKVVELLQLVGNAGFDKVSLMSGNTL